VVSNNISSSWLILNFPVCLHHGNLVLLHLCPQMSSESVQSMDYARIRDIRCYLLACGVCHNGCLGINMGSRRSRGPNSGIWLCDVWLFDSWRYWQLLRLNWFRVWYSWWSCRYMSSKTPWDHSTKINTFQVDVFHNFYIGWRLNAAGSGVGAIGL